VPNKHQLKEGKMPKTVVHIEASVKKTGKSHQAVHAFVHFEKKNPNATMSPRWWITPG